MARYIDVDILLNFVKENTPHINGETTMQCVEKAIKEAPIADVEEVKHGEWVKVGKTKGGSNILQCSVCGNVRKGIGKSAYCRDCGAKMDGERTDT